MRLEANYGASRCVRRGQYGARHASHVRGGAALLAGHRPTPTATSSSSSARTIPAPTIPPTARGATRSPPTRCAWEPGDADPADRLHRGRARGLARSSAASSRPSTSATPAATSSRAPPRSTLPCDHIPQLDEVTADLEPLTGFSYLPAAGLVPLKQFYGALGDRDVLLDAVRPPLGGAALHARARPDPRGDRPRQPARRAALRRDQAPGRPRRPARAHRRGAAVPRRRLLVHDRVRRRARGTARCAPTAPGSSPPTARSRSSAAPTCARSTCSRWATLEYDITQYQPVLFCADVDRRARGRRRRLLRRVRRRHAGAPARVGAGRRVAPAAPLRAARLP